MDLLSSLVGGDSGLWSSTSTAAMGLADALKLPNSVVDYLFSETHCYESIRTHSASEHNANCFTVSPSGTFSKVFCESDAATWSKKSHQGHVIPGLWDGHGHLLQYGEFLNSVDLFGSKSFDEIIVRVDGYLDAHPDAGNADNWLRGTGWDQAAFGRMPTAVRILQS